MKKIKYISSITVLAIMMALVACNPDDGTNPSGPEATPQEIVTAALTAGTWNTSGVQRDGSSVTEDFSSFTLTFGSGNYSTTNGGTLWNSTGSWAFVGDSVTDILLDGDRPATLGLSGSNLTLTFTNSEDVFGGRQKSVDVTYVFSLNQ